MSASASCCTASGSTTTTGPRGRCCPGRHGRAGHERQQLDEPLGRQPAFERLHEGAQLAPAREALVQHRGERRQQRARREEVGERQRLEGLERRRSRAACRGRSGAGSRRCRRRTRSAPGSSRVGGEDVEDAAAARHLAGRRHRILARVAAFVERLEQDLGRQLVAHAHARARASPAGAARGSAAAGPTGDATTARAPPARRVQRRGAPGRGARRGAAGRGRAAGPAPAATARRPRGPAAAASVRRSCAVSSTSRSRGTTTRSGALGEQQRQRAPRSGPERPASCDTSALRASARRASRAADRSSERSEPGGQRHGRRMRSTSRGGGAARHERHAHHASAGGLDLGPPDDLVRAPSRRPSPARRAAAPSPPRAACPRRRRPRGRPPRAPRAPRRARPLGRAAGPGPLSRRTEASRVDRDHERVALARAPPRGAPRARRAAGRSSRS